MQQGEISININASDLAEGIKTQEKIDLGEKGEIKGEIIATSENKATKGIQASTLNLHQGNLKLKSNAKEESFCFSVDKIILGEKGTVNLTSKAKSDTKEAISFNIRELLDLKQGTITAEAEGKAETVAIYSSNIAMGEKGKASVIAKAENNIHDKATAIEVINNFDHKQGNIELTANAKNEAKGLLTHQNLILGEKDTVDLKSTAVSNEQKAIAVEVSNLLDFKRGKIIAEAKGKTEAVAIYSRDIKIDKTASIDAKAESETGKATAAHFFTSNEVKNLTATAKGKEATALLINGSKINIHNTNLKAEKTNNTDGFAHALNIKAANSQVIFDNSKTKSTIIGDIKTANNVQLDLKLAEHNTFGYYSDGTNSQLNITLDKNATWENTKTGETAIRNLRGEINSKIKMSDGNIKISELDGEGVQAEFKLDGDNIKGGKVFIENIKNDATIFSLITANQQTIDNLKATGKLQQVLLDLENRLETTSSDDFKKLVKIWNSTKNEIITNEKTAKFLSNSFIEKIIQYSAPSIAQSLVIGYRGEMNNLNKRLGDLRLAKANNGIWGRIYGGKNTAKKVGSTDFKHTSVQLGYDRNINEEWIAGGAFSYTNGKSNGDGLEKYDARNMTLGIYATCQQETAYIDVIAKYGFFTTDLKTTNPALSESDFTNQAVIISAEYGQRFYFEKFSLEPQLEMIFGYLTNSKFDLPTNIVTLTGGKHNLNVKMDSYNSFISRVGTSVGNATNNYSWHCGASVYHEFLGDIKTTVAGSETTLKGTDTWVSLELGGAKRFGEKTTLYGNFEKTFAGDYNNGWEGELGIRYSF